MAIQSGREGMRLSASSRVNVQDRGHRTDVTQLLKAVVST